MKTKLNIKVITGAERVIGNMKDFFRAFDAQDVMAWWAHTRTNTDLHGPTQTAIK
jgi:hypothetical protein